MAGKVKKSSEDLLQEGREEVLDWLVRHEIVKYSRVENIYFMWDWKSETITVLPWRKDDE
jgi:hypothetical protein